MNKYNNEFDACDKLNRPGMGEFYQDHHIKLTEPTIKQKQARGYHSFHGKKNILGNGVRRTSLSTNQTAPWRQFAMDEKVRRKQKDLPRDHAVQEDERVKEEKELKQAEALVSQRKREAKERQEWYELLNQRKRDANETERLRKVVSGLHDQRRDLLNHRTHINKTTIDRGLDLNDIRIIEEDRKIVTRDKVIHVKPLKDETQGQNGCMVICLFLLIFYCCYLFKLMNDKLYYYTGYSFLI